MKSFKCPYCHVEIIKDLEEVLKQNRKFEECPNCNSLIWRAQLENEL